MYIFFRIQNNHWAKTGKWNSSQINGKVASMPSGASQSREMPKKMHNVGNWFVHNGTCRFKQSINGEISEPYFITLSSLQESRFELFEPYKRQKSRGMRSMLLLVERLPCDFLNPRCFSPVNYDMDESSSIFVDIIPLYVFCGVENRMKPCMKHIEIGWNKVKFLNLFETCWIHHQHQPWWNPSFDSQRKQRMSQQPWRSTSTFAVARLWAWPNGVATFRT